MTDTFQTPPPDPMKTEEYQTPAGERRIDENEWGPPVDDNEWGSPHFTSGDLDRRSGSDFPIRLEMARAMNPSEANLVMQKYYKPGEYGQDGNGNWWYTNPETGKPTSVWPEGWTPTGGSARSPSALLNAGLNLARTPGVQNVAAQLGGSATPTAGATTGAVIGGGLGGPPGAVVGAGLGAAAGWSTDQLVKWYRGLFNQKPQEVARNMVMEGGINAAMQGAAPAVSAIGRGTANRFRNWVGVTPETASLSGQLTDAGARAPISSVAPGFQAWSDKQNLRNLVVGDPWEARNVAYVEGRFRDALSRSGVPDPEVDALIASGRNPSIAPPAAPAGELMVTRAQSDLGRMQTELITARQEAENILRGHERSLRGWAEGTGRNMEAMSEDVAGVLIDQRRAFGNAMGNQYRSIDSALGGERVFNLEPAWQRAREIIDLVTPDHVPPYLKRMMARYDDVLAARTEVTQVEAAIRAARQAGQPTEELERQLVKLRVRANGNMTTFHEGHDFRSNLREIQGHDYNPLRSPWEHKLGQVEDVVDDTFRAMESSPGLTGRTALRLRETDDQYRRGIQVFKDTRVRKLMSDIRDGVGVDPENVASTIISMGHTASGRRILGMLPDELRGNVARADMRNIINESLVRDPVTGVQQIDGIKFLDAIDNPKRARLLEELHGAVPARTLRMFGAHLAGLEGKVSIDALPPGPALDAIRATIRASNQIDTFVRRNPLGALTSGDPRVVDRAVITVGMPGNEAATVRAANYFGVDSPQWHAVQKNAMQRVVRQSLVETSAGQRAVSGPAIEKILGRYTEKQQELLFPNGIADDLREVARHAKFLFPRSPASDFGSSLAAKSVTLHTGVNVFNPTTWNADVRRFYISTMGWLIDHPRTMKFLAGTLKREPSEGRAMLGFLFRAQVNATQRPFGMQGPGRGQFIPPPIAGDQDGNRQ